MDRALRESDNVDTRLGQLERDVGSMVVIVGRLDTTVEKLADVASDLSKIMAVQDKRLEVAEKNLERLESIVEGNKTEFNAKFVTTENTFKKEITDNQDQIYARLDKIDERLTSIERWKWLLIGAGAVLGFILKAMFGVL